jgi:hypothetical protein
MKTNILLSELEQLINSAFNTAEYTHETAEATRDRVQREVTNPLDERYKSGRPKFSTYLKAYAFGYIQAKRNHVMQNLVEFCYLVDGTLYSTHKDSTHQTTEVFYKAGRGQELGEHPRAFYWKGTDKPYTEVSK